jgi:SSS family solute:Na+ symporter
MMDGAAGLSFFDLAIIVTYMAGVAIIGAYYSKYVKNASDFFVAGRALPFWAIGMSIIVSDIGASDFVFVGGATYTYGVSAANFDWMGSMPAMIIAAFIFMPYYWRAGVYTIPEFLGRRYNAGVQILHAGIWGVFMLFMLVVIFWSTAQFLYTVLGWSPQFSIILTLVVVGIYTISGGLQAVVMTDVIQMIVMFVGGLSLLALCMWEVGGWGALQEKVLAAGPQYADHFTLLLPNDADTPYPWAGIVFGLGIVMSTAYFSGHQAVVQRCFGARSEWDAKAGMLLAGFLKSFIPVMVALPGLAAIVLVPGIQEGDHAVPMMIREIMPAGIRGLTFSALVASFMSSADTYLSSASTIWTTDLFGRGHHLVTGRYPSERLGLIMGRGFTAAFLAIAAVFAWNLDSPGSMYNFVQEALSMFQGPVFAILLVGIMWARATRWGGLAGLILGVAFTTILSNTEGIFPSQDPFLFVSFWSFIFTCFVTVVVSLLTPKEPEEKLRGLVFGQVMKDGKIQRVLLERVEE